MVYKLSVSMERALGDEVREAAASSGSSLSAWIAAAARDRLRRNAWEEWLAEWEAEEGELTPDELSRAAQRLGLPEARRDDER